MGGAASAYALALADGQSTGQVIEALEHCVREVSAEQESGSGGEVMLAIAACENALGVVEEKLHELVAYGEPTVLESAIEQMIYIGTTAGESSKELLGCLNAATGVLLCAGS